jgi:hypothetical protein
MLKAGFLIIVGGIIFKLSLLQIVMVIVLYTACSEANDWITRRAARSKRDKALDYEISGWEVDPNDETHEVKGALTRIRLTGTDQIIVTRVAHLLWNL